MAPTTRSKGLKAKKVAPLKQTKDAGVHKPSKLRHRPGYVHVPPLISTSMSESSNVSEASFSHLPPELKIQIFECLDSVSAVTALSSTSRTFNSIWKVNANQICDAIVQRTIESPVEAKALIDAQQSTRQTKDNQNLKKVQRDQNDYQQAARRLQQYLVNKRMASNTVRYFEDRQPSRTVREQAHFIQAYYRTRVLVLLSTDGIPRSLITTWSMLDFKRVYEILDNIWMCLHWQYRKSSSAVVSEEERETVLGRRSPVSKWEVALLRMILLEGDILAMLPGIDPYWPGQERRRPFVTYDLDEATTDKLRNLPLAEILPRLPEWSLCRHVDFDSVLRQLDW